MIKENLTPSNYHSEWQNSRINFLINKYGEDFFNKKTILELAPYNGYIGAYFHSIGADVCLLEGRQENKLNINANYPQLKCYVVDLDRDDWRWGKWDIIINFGLYYHLEKFHKEHLENCLDNSNIMFFETVVYDSNEAEILFVKEFGPDQSLTGIGGNPSTSYIENILISKNKRYEKFSDSRLNEGGHIYDWIDTGNKIYNGYQRRFWIIQ